jgi:mono/diheme cytochrome c family protein
MFAVIRSFAALSIGALAFGACQRAETVAAHMQEHFTQVSTIQDAVIRGDLEAVAEPAEWLARHRPVDSLPAGWEPYVADMSLAAQRALEASTIEDAAAAAAAMGLACGACHQATETGPKFTLGAEVNTARGVGAHMQRHRWAADRMWEGLVGPSDTSWAWGAASMREAALRPQGQPEQIEDLAKQVHQLGAQAEEAIEPEARATVYGELLGTCADCHTALGRGPAAQGSEIGSP